MGDRGNIVIKDSRGMEIYLYTHWYGTELPQTLRVALQRGRDRWYDDLYLARIIFSEMIKDDVLGTTGFGIGTYQCDANHPDIVVDVPNQTVGYRGRAVVSFQEYIIVPTGAPSIQITNVVPKNRS